MEDLTMKMKKISSLVLALTVAMTMLFTVPVFADTNDGANDPTTGSNPTSELGVNGRAAKAYFGADEYNNLPLEKATPDMIQDALYSARDITADTGKPVIVDVKAAGIYYLSSALSVPKNVILVSESGVIYKRSGSDRMVLLKGSVYGGTFDGNNANNNIIQMTCDSVGAADKNMTVMKATLKNSKLTAVQIDANGKSIKHGKVIDNNISNCYNGVSVYDGGSYDLISGNTISTIGSAAKKGGSAIDVCSSNVSKISNNKISNVIGHGISTDPTSDHNAYRYGCKIGEISGNTIKTIKTQGIYIENKCSVTKISNNKISNVKGCCITVDKNARINGMAGNTLSGGSLAKKGKHSLMTLGGKKSYVKVGKNNKFTGSYAAGIYVGKKAKLVITGKGNVITKNKMNGIQMDKGSVLKITGKTSITKNRWGINMAKGANANIKNVKFKGNKKGAVYYIKGAKFKKSKCSVKGKIYKAN